MARGSAHRLLGSVLCLVAVCGAGCGEDPDSSPAGDTSAPDADTDVAHDTTPDGSDDATADVAVEVDTFVPDFPADPPSTVGGDRPARVTRPRDYDATRPWPVVILLHGYGASGLVQSAYLGLPPLANELGFLLVAPDGTPNADNSRFWNGTPACCNFEQRAIDDVAYITGLVAELSETHYVDPGRVYTLGHSNGGFMSYRLACEASETFTAIASLAGASFDPIEACGTPSRPVSVLQVHGTDDGTIRYGGGLLFNNPAGSYPSARASVSSYAALAGCDIDAAVEGEPLDLEVTIDGAESTSLAWSTGCAPGTSYALWTIEGGGHIPSLNPTGTRQMVEWLLSQTR